MYGNYNLGNWGGQLSLDEQNAALRNVGADYQIPASAAAAPAAPSTVPAAAVPEIPAANGQQQQQSNALGMVQKLGGLVGGGGNKKDSSGREARPGEEPDEGLSAQNALGMIVGFL